MATRHNTCVNPALGVDNSGWGGGSTPTRTDVTSESFGRQWAARYTSGTFTSSARGAVSPGLTYTLSVYVYIDNAFASNTGTIFIEWRKANSDVIVYDSTSYDVPGRVVTRISITATAPALSAFAGLITNGINFASSTGDFTMVLIEQAATLDTYFDGDSPSASWDGTAGLSASTLVDEQTVAAGRAAETDTARALTVSKTATLGQAAETDTARTLAVSKTFALGRAAETGTARPLAVSKTVLLGRAVETSTARPLAVSKTLTIGRAAETDTARPVTVTGGAPAGLHNLGGNLVSTGVLGGSLI